MFALRSFSATVIPRSQRLSIVVEVPTESQFYSFISAEEHGHGAQWTEAREDLGLGVYERVQDVRNYVAQRLAITRHNSAAAAEAFAQNEAARKVADMAREFDARSKKYRCRIEADVKQSLNMPRPYNVHCAYFGQCECSLPATASAN
jgi:hypothetical protein